MLLQVAFRRFVMQKRTLGCSRQALKAMLSAAMAAAQQNVSALQLRAVPLAQKRRAVRRARREGSLQVHSLYGYGVIQA